MSETKCSNPMCKCHRRDQDITRLQLENKLLKEKLAEQTKSDEHEEIRRLHEYEGMLR